MWCIRGLVVGVVIGVGAVMSVFGVVSECGWFEVESDAFVQSEQEVHVVYGCARGSFEEVVDDGCYEQSVVDSFEVQDALVGVDYVFEVDRKSVV